jgi:hypothetical protein
MPSTASTCAGLACVALVLASFVPGVSDAATGEGQVAAAPAARTSVMRKGDRLQVHRGAVRQDVASTDVAGDPGRASIFMRTRVGIVAYKADEVAGVTAATKNVSIPALPARMAAKPAAASTVMAAPAVASQPAARAALPVGCERLVSVLVKSSERDRVGRCLS